MNSFGAMSSDVNWIPRYERKCIALKAKCLEICWEIQTVMGYLIELLNNQEIENYIGMKKKFTIMKHFKDGLLKE
jgi:hypothetical protein